MKSRAWLSVMIAAVLVASAGAGCPRAFSRYTPQGPRVLPAVPSLDDVTRAVNGNTSRVLSLHSTDATINAPWTPPLKASIAVDRPRRLRVRAETSLTGPEVDLGSNDQLFWVWVKRMQPPTVMFCRHEQYHASAARQILPIEPDWVIEALGLPTFDPAAQHTGPVMVRGNRLEIRTVRNGPEGPVIKATVVDAANAWVYEQHVYDAHGNRLASALASQHTRDPATGIVLPRRVEFQIPATQTKFTLNLGNVQINQLDPATALFDMPSYPGAAVIDLADPNVRPNPAFTSAPNQRPATSTSDTTPVADERPRRRFLFR
ncbi:MAG TPA: hypothetical protein VHZ24_17155 [Pirellulales bacterium]|nr:hypothetical protein [Pirellulales bacterium]